MFKCFLCKRTFLYFTEFINHIKFFHKTSNISNFICSFCCQSFHSFQSFKRHMRKHEENENSFTENNHVYDNENISNFTSVQNPQNFCNSANKTDCNDNSSNLFDNENNKLDGDIITTMQCKNYKSQLINFFLKLYAKPTLSRKFANEVINDVFIFVFLTLNKNIEYILDLNLSLDNTSHHIKKCFTEFKQMFIQFNSEYKVMNYLKSKSLYIQPTEFVIDECLTIDTLSTELPKGILLPFKNNLKQYLQLPNTLSNMLNEIKELKTNTSIKNIIQGSVWQLKSKTFGNEIFLPYILYQDEFEVNNPLGSKRGVDKLSVVYITFPLLKDSEFSKLCNIFPCCLTRSCFLSYGTLSNFRALCNELKELENGIEIKTEKGVFKIHLVLASLAGDNLGLNTIMGFTRSFSANTFCRICTSSKEITKTQVTEDKNTLRNENNYLENLLENDVSKTGVRESCVFNSLDYFHVTDCVSVDMMHDLFEGICHVELGYILDFFINEKKFFSLYTLNQRKSNFNYGLDQDKLSTDITSNHIKDKKFRMSASEMQCFMHYLPVIVGDLVPKNNKVWNFLLVLIKLIEICSYPSFNDQKLEELENTITKHHKLYLKIFKETLIPKHHFILHYPSVIRKLGPLKKLWTMRFEAKHKILKAYASVITSRRNIGLSLATKLQLEFAYRIHNYIPDTQEIHAEDLINVDIENIQNCNEFVLERMKQLGTLCFYKSVSISNTTYKVENVITFIENDIHYFYEIAYIFKNSKSSFFIAGKEIKITSYDSHYQSYMVDYVHSHVNKIMKCSSLNYPPIHKIILYNKNIVLRPKQPYS